MRAVAQCFDAPTRLQHLPVDEIKCISRSTCCFTQQWGAAQVQLTRASAIKARGTAHVQASAAKTCFRNKAQRRRLCGIL